MRIPQVTSEVMGARYRCQCAASCSTWSAPHYRRRARLMSGPPLPPFEEIYVKKVLGPALAFVLFVFLGWYAGVDYLQRGGDQAYWIGEGILAGLAVFLFRRATSVPLQLSSSRAVRLTLSLLIPLLVLALGWYGGVDLAARGSRQAYVLACALGAGWATWSCPVWKPVGGQW
jgi:hypothetical protein